MTTLRRRRPPRTTKTSVLIVTNGERTENSYLGRLKQEARSQGGLAITVRVIRGDPKTVLKKLSSPKGDTSGYDEVWIVVDEDGVDRTGFVEQCARKSPAGKWFGIVSRPCFEVWLIAHYERVRNYQDQKDAQRHFNELAPVGKVRESDKHLPASFPFDQYRSAAGLCRLAGVRAVGVGELPPSPGTGMDHLVARLLCSAG